MELLYFFEGLRNPVLDAFFALITHLGEETLFIIAGLLFFWCIDKLEGYYLLTVGLSGTVINQFLKLIFRVPRPWMKDPGFTIVESARAEATGYSFPSGHTQSAVGIFAAIARWHCSLCACALLADVFGCTYSFGCGRICRCSTADGVCFLSYCAQSTGDA